MKPSLKVGLKEFKDIISQANAKAYNNDPLEMLDAMENAFYEITINRHSTYDQYMDHLFKALKTFKNRVFVDYVTRLEDEWDTDATKDTPATIDLFIQTVRTSGTLWILLMRKFWHYQRSSRRFSSSFLWSKLKLLRPRLLPMQPKQVQMIQSLLQTKGILTLARQSLLVRMWLMIGAIKGTKVVLLQMACIMPAGHNHNEWLAKKLACRSQHSTQASTEQVNSVKLALSEKMKACLVTKASFSKKEAKALFDDVHLN